MAVADSRWVPCHRRADLVKSPHSAVEDLRTGRSLFRKGASMVKELYAGHLDRPTGYAVMVKVRRRSGATGRGWLFYETLDGTNGTASFGRGLRLCTGCHRSGVDFLRSECRP